ncbi:hypothetical protein [Bradyrhizobium sp. CCBAU 53421]|uniref:hypothetical protein n=1 Tax=Bradyrhizobium sp. CCBAU 53421 TaxID=1325120 RepID=UPI00188A19C2|nr:hypothetical protein [Bradyrhizobium sp. CCBAU 53421]QOZ34965.1 hypothetical protein XH92_27510 [Bradyrhizobium sp. CCBAU 53421]
MIKVLKVAARVVWRGTVIALGTLVGAHQGLVHYGWGGAVALGAVGFLLGVLVAADPLGVIDFMELIS